MRIFLILSNNLIAEYSNGPFNRNILETPPLSKICHWVGKVYGILSLFRQTILHNRKKTSLGMVFLWYFELVPSMGKNLFNALFSGEKITHIWCDTIGA